MYFIGVDLAWGLRRPTGVAVVDGGGVLRYLGVAGDDEDVADRVRPFTAGECLMAVDAPLVVANPSGNRPCEAALNRDFRAFEAGAHPSNTALTWFADGGRGARLCAALDLDLDPRSPAPRKAIEVYPHAASVVLFGLDRTLKYKQKPGRELTERRSELLRLIDFLEGLRTADPMLEVSDCPEWTELKASVRRARRKSELRRAEDPADAVLCAYIARFAASRPGDVTVYGDTETGCLVTPTLR